jgi:hypothetical protein
MCIGTCTSSTESTKGCYSCLPASAEPTTSLLDSHRAQQVNHAARLAGCVPTLTQLQPITTGAAWTSRTAALFGRRLQLAIATAPAMLRQSELRAAHCCSTAAAAPVKDLPAEQRSNSTGVSKAATASRPEK